LAWPRLWQNTRGQVINSRLLECLLSERQETGDLLQADRCWTDGFYRRAVNLVMLNSCLPAHPSWRRGGEEQRSSTVPAMTGPSPGHTSASRHMASSSPCHSDVSTATHSFVLIATVLAWLREERSAQIRRWFLVAFCLV